MALISVAKVMSFQLVTKCMSLFRFINQPGGLCLIVCQLMGYDILIQSQTPTRHVNDSSSSNSAPVEPRLMRVAWMTSSLFQLKGVRWSKEQIRISLFNFHSIVHFFYISSIFRVCSQGTLSYVHQWHQELQKHSVWNNVGLFSTNFNCGGLSFGSQQLRVFLTISIVLSQFFLFQVFENG